MEILLLNLKAAGPILQHLTYFAIFIFMWIILRRQSREIEALSAFAEMSTESHAEAVNKLEALIVDCDDNFKIINDNFGGFDQELNGLAKSFNRATKVLNRNNKRIHKRFLESESKIKELKQKTMPLPAHGPDGKFAKKPKADPNKGKYECMVSILNNFTLGKFYTRFESRNTSPDSFILIGDDLQRHPLNESIEECWFRLVV